MVMNCFQLYERACEKWGIEAQVIVCIEELSELTKELTKYLRGKGNINHIAEELADVRITTEQMTHFTETGLMVDEIMEEKLKRLEERL